MLASRTTARRLRERTRTLVPVGPRDNADCPAEGARYLDFFALFLLLLVLAAPARDALRTHKARRVERVLAYLLPIAADPIDGNLAHGRRVDDRERILIRRAETAAHIPAAQASLALHAFNTLA